MTDSTSIQVFCFCWYPDNWLPRAIFVPMKDMDNETKLEVLKITNMGPIIKTVWHPYNDIMSNRKTRIGFQINKNRYISDKDLNITLSSWEYLTDYGHFGYCRNRDEDSDCACPNYIKNSIGYFINDLNRHLKPLDLYQKLKSITNYQNQNISVTNCVVLYDGIDEEKTATRPLRFSYNKDIDKNKLEGILINNFNLEKVLLASSNYGYVYLKDVSKESDLINKQFELEDGLKIFFDKG